jgi:hypothetical protein
MSRPVIAIDLQPLGNTSTSGCEAVDFAGFPPGNIALSSAHLQLPDEGRERRPAGAIGAIIFNQGNTPDRTGLFVGT